MYEKKLRDDCRKEGPVALGSTTTGVECKGERPIIDIMSITANRLEDVERKLGVLHNFLFGPEPQNGEGSQVTEPNVRSLASCAFGSSVRLEQMCDEIYHRLAQQG